MNPRFLELDEVLLIHKDQVERYGGRPGIRDSALLRSALAMPSAGMAGQYLHTDLMEMAAAYMFHVVKNHPFIDGNKRVGAVAALVFLELNDIDVRISEGELFDLIMSLAKGEISKSGVAEYLRARNKP